MFIYLNAYTQLCLKRVNRALKMPILLSPLQSIIILLTGLPNPLSQVKDVENERNRV